MKRINFQLIICFFTLSVLTVSCRKNQDKNDSAEIAQQSSLAQTTMNNLGIMTAEAIHGSFSSFAATCATITYDTTGVSKGIVINYGTIDCVCADGKRRRGVISVSAPTGFVNFGSVITTSTSNYFVNDTQVDGSRSITLTNLNTSKINSVATVTLPEDRGTFTWNGDFVRTYLSGKNTPYIQDDEYTYKGSANGINTKNVEYNMEITDPLKIQMGCRWIKGGIFKITASSIKEEATLDYGTGDCDNKATLKYGKKETIITI